MFGGTAAPADSLNAASLAPTYVTSWGNYAGETWGLAADSHGNLYVPDSEDMHVDKYDADGHLLLSFGTSGNGPGQFYRPYWVVVNSRDEVLVLDHIKFSIQVFDGDGVYLRAIPWERPRAYIPITIELDPADNVYVVEESPSAADPPWPTGYRVQKFSPSGAHLLDFDLAACSIADIRFLCSDGQGALYGGVGGDQYVKFSDTGDCLASLGGSGSAPGQFSSPGTIGFLGDGTLVCADPGNHRVQLLTPAGAFLASWDTAGPEGGFVYPSGVLVVGSNVYVTDQQRIHKFSFLTTPVVPTSWGRLKARFR